MLRAKDHRKEVLMSLHTLSFKNASLVAQHLQAHGFKATGWMSCTSPKLWLYTLLASLSGGQMPFPLIQAWQNHDAVLGVAIMQSDPVLTFRRYLIGFDVEACLEQAWAIQLDFLEALFQFHQKRGVRFILVELSPLDSARLTLFKHQGFQVALEDAYFYWPTRPREEEQSAVTSAVISTFSEEGRSSTGEGALRQAGYKRVTPAHARSVCEHYNQQLPLLWKHALSKVPQHFKPTAQVERWFLPLSSSSSGSDSHRGVDACGCLVELHAPVDPSLHEWRLWILPPLHQVVEVKALLDLWVDYIRMQDPQAVIRLQVNQCQTALKKEVASLLPEAVEHRRVCLIKELKARPRSGIQVHVPTPSLGLDGASPAFGMQNR
jgi:hypothetical protein